MGHDPNPTQPPTVYPPHENCETGWFFLESTRNCHFIDHTLVSGFHAAESHCVGLGGHLLSINGPNAQQEIRHHLTDPSSVGERFLIF